MRLVSFTHDGGRATPGLVSENGVTDISRAAPTIAALIEYGLSGGQRAETAAAASSTVPLKDIHLLAPIPNPPEFLGVGLNYHDHATEMRMPVPVVPTIFNKQVTCVSGPTDDIEIPAMSDQLDYEGELGLIIGQAGRYLSLEEAGAAIFGYVVVNDLSVRDVQTSSPTITLGKSFDTHGPFGPWIVTADEIDDPQALVVETRVNGVVRQRASTADMVLGCAEIVAFLSRFVTLRPGTVVTTGTPAGVGWSRTPPAFLEPGDRVTVEISGIGILTNRVVVSSARPRDERRPQPQRTYRRCP